MRREAWALLPSRPRPFGRAGRPEAEAGGERDQGGRQGGCREVLGIVWVVVGDTFISSLQVLRTSFFGGSGKMQKQYSMRSRSRFNFVLGRLLGVPFVWRFTVGVAHHPFI